jgi:hypothetical protein
MKRLPTEAAIIPKPGNFLTLAFARLDGGCLLIIMQVSAHEEWFPIVVP